MRVNKRKGFVPEPRQCEWCGKWFMPTTRANRFCSDPCRLKSHNRPQYKMFDRTCKWCGKPFTTTYIGKKYCNVKCKNKASVDKRNKAMQEPKPCKLCGLYFVPTIVRPDYCCADCAAIAKMPGGSDVIEAKIMQLRGHDAVWRYRMIRGDYVTTKIKVAGLAFSDPQCTPLEGLRELEDDIEWRL